MDIPLYRRRRLTISSTKLDIPRALEVIRNLQVSFSRAWEEALLRGEVDALVTLLLSQLANLQSLKLGPCFTLYTDLSASLLNASLRDNADAHLPCFDKLGFVGYDFQPLSHRRMQQRDSHNMLPMFYLPGMRTITACLDNPNILSWPIHQHKQSHITCLDLSYIREKPLEQLLSFTPFVRKLKWTWLHDDVSNNPFDTSVVDLDQIITTLGHIRNTLEDLKIEGFCLSDGDVLPFFDVKGSFEGLRRFYYLKHLDIPLPFLATFAPSTGILIKNMLPENVERLAITDTFWPHECYRPGIEYAVYQDEWEFPEIMTALNSFLYNWKGSHPSLKGLEIGVDQMDEWEKPDWDAFASLTPEHGLPIKVSKRWAA
ncbi:hypothetical protein C1H76_7558 [Elsinoe australis]|uniref:Uncharacterized protein n=1 Tax=Elsinoe australis TaxID=40998 RepID=A0A4U7AQ09_9PEZI|nr:hypothetical protein C1H76_7558 [Elsinoe australis]